MSRYTGKEQADQILEAASEWRQLCLINGGSLFSNKNLWDSQHLAEIERDVVNSQLELEGNFMHRLKEQLASVSPEADLPPPPFPTEPAKLHYTFPSFPYRGFSHAASVTAHLHSAALLRLCA
ncbi:hypothetical protein ACV6RK_002315 [Cronobacter malonaticus]